MKSQVGRALAQKPFVKYVLGWVIGAIWSDGGEWLYRGNDYTNLYGRGKESDPTLYKTKENAVEFAKTIKSDKPLRIRIYIYETPNPENARGLTLLSETQDTEPVILHPNET